MLSYKAPLRDMRFVRDELLGFPALFAKLPGCEEFTPDLLDAVLGEAAKFCENVLAPLYRSGDEEGCTLTPEGVRTSQKAAPSSSFAPRRATSCDRSVWQARGWPSRGCTARSPGSPRRDAPMSS